MRTIFTEGQHTVSLLVEGLGIFQATKGAYEVSLGKSHADLVREVASSQRPASFWRSFEKQTLAVIAASAEDPLDA